MVHLVIGLVFIIQGINVIWGVVPATLMGVILIAGGAYVVYKKKGEAGA